MAKKQKVRFLRDFENMDDEAILSVIRTDMSASQTFQSPYFEKFKEYYKQYRSYVAETDKTTNRSNLFIPYTYHIIETVVPKLILSVFTSRPYVKTMPLGLPSELREKRAEKMNKLLDYQFQQKIHLMPICTDVFKTAAIYGTAVTKQSWDFREREVIKRRNRVVNGAPIEGLYDDVLVKSVTNDDPKVTLIPLLDFFFDPACTSIEDSRYDIHRYWEDLNELQEKKDQAPDLYKNIDKLDEKDEVGATSEDMLASIGISAGKNKRKGIEIWEYWTDGWVVKVANKDMVIYSARNPYFHMKKPFARWVDNPVPGEFYGIGEVEAIKVLQEELNTTRNQRIDNVSFVLNKMWKILRGANVDTTQLVSRPAGFIEVDELNDIEEVTFEDVTQSAYQEEAVIKADMDRTTGVNDTERGTQTSRRETATTMSILANAGNERFKLKTLLTEYGGFHEMVNQIVGLNQQYIDRPKEILLLGDDGSMDNDTITPEEIWGQWAIVAVGSAIEPVINKEARQTQLVQLYNIIQSRPDVNHTEMLKRIFEEFDIDNIDAIFTTPGVNMNPDMMQQLIKSGAIGQGGAQGGNPQNVNPMGNQTGGQ